MMNCYPSINPTITSIHLSLPSGAEQIESLMFSRFIILLSWFDILDALWLYWTMYCQSVLKYYPVVRRLVRRMFVVVPLFLYVCSLCMDFNQHVCLFSNTTTLPSPGFFRKTFNTIRITKQTFCKFIISAVSWNMILYQDSAVLRNN